MHRWWNDLDRVLRGEATRDEMVRGGRLDLPVARLAAVLVSMGIIYGLCMGSFALWHASGPRWMQLVSSALKVPALYLLTLVVTLPSLYVFNALIGARLDVVTVFRLLVTSLAVMLTVLASLGPIVAFFGVSTPSYPFMVLLNVAVFAASGVLGLGFLLRTLERLGRPPGPGEKPLEAADLSAGPSDAETAGAARTAPGPLERTTDDPPSRHVRVIFRCWVVLFGLVGAQMAWVLRPFLGHPRAPFAWFRPRTSNFFEAVLHTVADLFR